MQINLESSSMICEQILAKFTGTAQVLGILSSTDGVKHLHVVLFCNTIICTTKATKWSFSLSSLREEGAWREVLSVGNLA